MTEAAPQYFQWTGEVMVPLRPKLADREYVVGQRYRLGEIEDRSINSHNHYFACLAEAHANLPDDLAAKYPSSEVLRKHALIATGFYNVRDFPCATKAEAARMAKALSSLDEYSVVVVSGTVVRLCTAKSQNNRSMSKAEFQDSKQKVLDWISGLIGATRNELEQHAGAAA